MTEHPGPELSSQPRTIKRGGGRAWIHPAAVRGPYATRRLVTSSILLIVLYMTPWLTINGQPFIRLSFLESSFVLFGQPILIYEFHHFVLMALLLVFTLFLASALYGRIWCGYACPQTIFVEQIFGRIEAWLEGPAARRILNESKPMTWQLACRKAVKQLLFAVISASFGFTMVAIFTGPYAMLTEHRAGAISAAVLLSALAWFDGAYWREQFCHIVCPYGRFQGVMQDAATRTIGYDEARGEPRRRGKDRVGAGDCIDCGLCVRVCPSGIDIRQGPSQLECIGCAKCIDACNGVMASVGKAQGLIRYDTVLAFSSPKEQGPATWFRPRLVVYGVIWSILLTVGIYDFINRDSFHARLLSASGSAPYVLDGTEIKSLLTIKLGNQWRTDDSFDVSVAMADPGFASVRIGSPTRLGPLPPGSERAFPLLLIAPRDLTGKDFVLTIRAIGSAQVQTIERKVIGPRQAP